MQPQDPGASPPPEYENQEPASAHNLLGAPPAASHGGGGISRNRRISWALIVVLAAVAAGLTMMNNSPGGGAPVSVVDNTPTGLPAGPADNPVAPGTTDTPAPDGNGSANGGGSGVTQGASVTGAELSAAASSLGNKNDQYREVRVYAGYTVSAGTVQSADEALINSITQGHGKVIANVTDNQGGPTVLHAQVTFTIPQDAVNAFVEALPGDYQEYGKEMSRIDRSDAYAAAVAQNIRDQGQITLLTSQRDAAKDAGAAADLNAQIVVLRQVVATRQAAIDDADNDRSMAHLTLLLDERHAGVPTGLQAAWLAGTRNALAILTGLAFLGLSAGPVLILALPFWVFRRRIVRALHLSGSPR